MKKNSLIFCFLLLVNCVFSQGIYSKIGDKYLNASYTGFLVIKYNQNGKCLDSIFYLDFDLSRTTEQAIIYQISNKCSKDSIEKMNASFKIENKISNLKNVESLLLRDNCLSYSNSLLKLKRVKYIWLLGQKKFPTFIKDFDSLYFIQAELYCRFNKKCKNVDKVKNVKILHVSFRFPRLLIDLPNIEELAVYSVKKIPEISKYKNLKFLWLTNCDYSSVFNEILKSSQLEYLKLNYNYSLKFESMNRLLKHPSLKIIDFYFNDTDNLSINELRMLIIQFKENRKELHVTSIHTDYIKNGTTTQSVETKTLILPD